MPKREHLVLCGGVGGPKVGGRATVRLDLHGSHANVKLSISDIARKLLVNIPDRLVDLLEIATYVYAADGAISRGGMAEALGGRKVGTGWLARCPAHDDRQPSLAIAEAKDGKLLVRCHAGCGQREVIAALRARGIWDVGDQRPSSVHAAAVPCGSARLPVS
jgi:hypothetical protein